MTRSRWKSRGKWKEEGEEEGEDRGKKNVKREGGGGGGSSQEIHQIGGGLVRTHQDPGRATSRRCCLRTEPDRKQTQEVGQDRNHCRDFTSPTVQSENGRVGRYLSQKQEIFTENNSNSNSDCLTPQQIHVITIRAESDAPPGTKEIREKKDSDKKVLKKKNSLGEEIMTSHSIFLLNYN